MYVYHISKRIHMYLHISKRIHSGNCISNFCTLCKLMPSLGIIHKDHVLCIGTIGKLLIVNKVEKTAWEVILRIGPTQEDGHVYLVRCTFLC